MQRPQRGTGARPRLRSVSVQDELKQRIDRGELPAGARLPSEPELAAELQVSRATLREALRAMELEGLLRRRQGSGTFVAEHPRMANSLDVNFGVTDAIRAPWLCLLSSPGSLFLVVLVAVPAPVVAIRRSAL